VVRPLEDQIRQQQQQYDQAAYQRLVSRVKPKPPVARNCAAAFLVGGTICAVAQVANAFFLKAGLAAADAAAATAMLMIFIGAFLTGLGIYDSLAKFGGAGAIIPITGFANSIVSPAMEFRMFTVAGPVLVYGFVSAVLTGLIAWLAK
jgi:stage V sporulation protein AC